MSRGWIGPVLFGVHLPYLATPLSWRLLLARCLQSGRGGTNAKSAFLGAMCLIYTDDFWLRGQDLNL